MAVFQVVVVVLKSAAGVAGRVNEAAFHLPSVKRQQGLEGLQVVARSGGIAKDMARSVRAQHMRGSLFGTEKAAWRSSQSSVGMGQAWC